MSDPTDKWIEEKLASGELPPWKCKSQREIRWMKEWTIQKIIEAEDREVKELVDDPNFDPEEGHIHIRDAKKDAVEAAWRGDLEPLRSYLRMIGFSDLLPFIGKPKRERGQTFQQRQETTKKALGRLAVLYTHKIRDLWIKTYNRKKRGEKVEPSAEGIAAILCGFDKDEVVDALRRTPRFDRPPTRVRRS